MTRPITRRRFVAASVGTALAPLWLMPRPARAQALTNLTVGMSFHNLDAAAAWIAQDKHLFEKYGLKVTIISIQGGGKTVQAMAAGDVPVSFVAAADVINARTKGVPLEMIAGLIDKFPYDFVVAKNITSPAQLKGTKCAISGFGSSSDFASRYAITKLGVDPHDVTFLQVGNETSRLAALNSGQIQSTVLTAGLDLAAFDLGYKPMLKLYTESQPYQHTGIAVNTTWAKAHTLTVFSFLKAIVAATVMAKNPADETENLAILHRYLRIKENELKQGFELYRDHFYEAYPFVTVPGMEFILRARKISQPVSDFYDNGYVQALKDQNFAAAAARS